MVFLSQIFSMKNDGYIRRDLTPQEIDAIRQTQATLALEGLRLDEDGIKDITKLIKGELTREEYQRQLRDQYAAG